MSFFKNLFKISSKPQRNFNLKRNDPCWCGSGKKYKRCHMEEDQRILERQRALMCSTKG